MTTELDRSTETELAASLTGVCKSYKHFELRNIHFAVESGTVAGLIGPNGAGKSTMMRIIMGLVQPSAGSVSTLGKAISSSEASAKPDIGYFSDDMRLYKPESIGWHMQFVRSLEVVPVFRARSGLRMNGQGDLQDERKEQEASIDCTATVYG